MTALGKTYEEMKNAVDEMSARRMAGFLKELETQMQQIGPLNGKVISATTIDNWLRRAESQAKLETGNLNRAAFEFWKVLMDAGATISHQDVCQIVPIPDIQERLARSIEEHFHPPAKK
jgi:hypothetical protein